MSTKTRLLLYFGILSAVGASVFVIFWLYGIPKLGIEGIQTTEYRRSMSTVESIDDKERDAFEQWFINRRRELSLFAKSELFASAVELKKNQHQIRAILERQLELIKESNSGAYKYLYLLNPNTGHIIASTNQDWKSPPREHADLIEESKQPGLNEFVYLMNEDDGNSVVITNQVIATDQDGQPNGDIIGILVASVGLHAPLKGEEQILLQSLGRSGAIMLVDEHKQILASTSQDTRDTSAQYLAQEVEVGSDGSKVLLVPDGREFQMAFRHLHLGAANSLSILTIRSSDEALALIRINFWRMVGLGIFMFVLAMSLVLFAANRIAITESQIRDLNASLEQRVESRTLELEVINNDLNETLLHLKKTKADLVQSEKLASLGALVAGVAHELNTPIGNAVLVASTLHDETNEFSTISLSNLSRHRFNDYMEVMRNGLKMLVINLDRSAELITNFKQLAIDQTSDQRRQFQLKTLAEEVVTAVKPSFKKAPYQIELHIPDDLKLDSYPGPLSRVLINCINNAVLHGFDSRDTGTIKLSANQLSINEIEINFSDDGIGMSDTVLHKVFDPFFTTKLGQGGNGLGMHIAYNTVTTLLGGHIEVKSQLGQGTHYRFIIPNIAPIHHEPEQKSELI